jgi:hypothetical protein
MGRVKALELLLDHRLCCLSGGYGVCVPMHYLPLTVFRSKDHRSPQSDWGDIFAFANLGPGTLHPHDVGKPRSYVLLYGLEGNYLAISERLCGTLHSRSNLLPSMRGRG